MIEVRLYNNFSDPTVVYKKLELVDTVQCEITKECNLDAPELLLDMDVDLPKYNYCYIEAFGRYYFCKPKIQNGNQMVIECDSDPLSSFWNDISKSDCIAERSTSHRNSDLVDDMLPFKPNPRLSFSTIGGGFTPSSSGGCYILTLGGK